MHAEGITAEMKLDNAIKRAHASVTFVVACPDPSDDCLDAILRGASSPVADAEVLVVVPGQEAASLIAHRVPPWMRVIVGAESDTLPALRRLGAELAAGDIIRLLDPVAFLREAAWTDASGASFEWQGALANAGAASPVAA